MVEAYLPGVIDDKKPVKIYTINGFQMVGNIVKDCDSFIVVEHDNKRSSIFKHAISTIEIKL